MVARSPFRLSLGQSSWLRAAALAALVYGVLLGATGLGELHPVLRIINGLVAGAVIAAYLVSVPRRADRIDLACVAALLVFLLAATLSDYPRQSFDSALGALTWTATFFAARHLAAEAAFRTALVYVLIGLSVVLTLVAAARWLPTTIEWWSLTRVTPPLDMNRSGVLWGHRHDLALVVGVLAPAWWIGPSSPLRRMAGIVFTALAAVLVLVDGSRTMWLAFLVAGLAVAIPAVLGRWQADRRWLTGGAVAVLVLVAAGTVAGVIPSLLDRLLTTNTLVSRADMWGALLQVWSERPIAGAGPGSFAWLLQGTSYFDANSWAPRHPDSLPFQLLPEVGLLGVIAVAVVVVAIAPAVWRGGWAPRFALVAMAVAGIGANPTEFGFLLLVGIAWVALASPNVTPMRTLRAEWPRPASLALLGVVGVAFAATALAAFAHDAARRAIAAGDMDEAVADLQTAAALDPGLALYPRLLGTAEWLAGEPAAGEATLRRAIELNPHDDLTWRTLALIQAEGAAPSEAMETIGHAVDLQRSDATNLLLELSMALRTGADPVPPAAEIVQAWPWLVGDDAWGFVAGSEARVAVAQAAHRAAAGEPAPQSNALNGIWIGVLSDRHSLLETGITGSGLTRTLGEAYALAISCDPALAAYLDAAPTADQRFDEFWALRVREAARAGHTDEDALRALEIMTGRSWSEPIEPMNPLDENGFYGLSADSWGYRRPPTTWPDLIGSLPSPDAAYQRWMLDPAGFAQTAGVGAMEACR